MIFSFCLNIVFLFIPAVKQLHFFFLIKNELTTQKGLLFPQFKKNH
jgi:hypothetical protein